VTSIRAQTPADAAAVRAVTRRAFGHHIEVADLVEALAAGPARLSLVAEDAGRVVGHVMLSRGWVDAERELVDVLVLSPLSVDPDVQRRGIGGRLVRAALAGAESLGAPAVFLEGSWRYYPRFGFEPGEKYGFSAPSPRIPGPAFQVVPLAAWQDWMTGQLVYPEAFWTHDSVGLRGERLRNVRAQVGH
jgi:putative acetyltransferase